MTISKLWSLAPLLLLVVGCLADRDLRFTEIRPGAEARVGDLRITIGDRSGLDLREVQIVEPPDAEGRSFVVVAREGEVVPRGANGPGLDLWDVTRGWADARAREVVRYDRFFVPLDPESPLSYPPGRAQ